MDDKNKPVTEKKLTFILANHPTNDDLKKALEPYVTKFYLKKALSNYPTKEDLKNALAVYATKDDLKSNNNELLEMFTTVMREFETRDRAYRVETERHFQVLLEEAEERFLKTGHDRIGLCEDQLKAINTRLKRVETVV